MSMRKIREVLRLTHELGLSVRRVREATGVGKTAVSEYVNRAKVVGITWPIPPEIGDVDLDRLLFTPAGFHAGSTKRLPDWTNVHEELKRRSVTLMILCEEHRAEHVDGHGYSRFCELYGAWRKRLSPTMRQTYVAGDKLFVDWAGGTVPIIDPMTGEVHEAHLFVAVLGASSYTYAEARFLSRMVPNARRSMAFRIAKLLRPRVILQRQDAREKRAIPKITARTVLLKPVRALLGAPFRLYILWRH
jgi:transposase